MEASGHLKFDNRLSEPLLSVRGHFHPDFRRTQLASSFSLHLYLRENPYLDSITRLIPTIKVSVHQNVHPDPSPYDSAERESDPPPHASLHPFNRSGIWEFTPPIQDKLTCVPPKPIRHSIFQKRHLCAKYPGPNYQQLRSSEKQANCWTTRFSLLYPLRLLLNHLPRQAFQPQLSSTPTPHISSAVDEERAPRLHEWYRRMTGRGSPPEPPAASTTGVLRSTLPGTPFRGPYPSFDMARDWTPSVARTYSRNPTAQAPAAPRGNTPLFLPTSHVSSPAPS